MLTTENDLKKIAQLAYLDIDDESTHQLAQDVGSIMDYVDQLRQVNTQSIPPLLHPLDLHQRLRPDVVTEENHLNDLAKIAPEFNEDLYLVPQIIEDGK